MSDKKLLGLKKEISARRPEFIMQDHHKRKETQRRWRKPKGMHSKMRHGVWGRPASVNTGYRGPAKVRGMHQNGLLPILVQNAEEAASIDPKTQGAIVASVGGRKKTQILQACKQKNITVLNVKNIDEQIQKLASAVTERKEAKKAAEQRKAAKTKAAPKKEEKKEETTKEQERKEMEKILTKKE
jgi:large subunit ribosomal protein L32e